MVISSDNWKPQIYGALEGAWQYRWYGLAAAWIFCVLGWIGIAMIPNSYESSARVYIDTDGLLQPLLRGLAVQPNSDQQIAMMLQTLMTTPNVKRVVEMTNPHANTLTEEQMRAAIRRVQDNVSLHNLQADHLFRISYTGSTPRKAQAVAQSLLSVLVDSHIGGVRRDADDVRTFLDNQIADYEKKLQQADARRANFKAAHLDFFANEPTSNTGATVSDPVASAQAAVAAAQNALIEAQARRDSIRAEMASVPATESFGGGASGQSALAEAEARLAMLRTQFKDSYPDVVAEKRVIAGLKAGRQPTTTGTKSEASGSSYSNPVYVQLREQEAAENADVMVAKEHLRSAESGLAKAKKNAVEAISVQRQYENLDRDYKVIHHNYETLVERRESAAITQAASDAGSSFVFRVVDPPLQPLRPVAPNRLVFNALILIAGLAVGAALAFGLSQFSGRFTNIDEITQAFSLPILGAVTMVRTPRDVARTRRAASLFALCTVALIGGYIVVLFAYHTPVASTIGSVI